MIRQLSDFFAKFWPHRDIWKNIDGKDTLYLRRFYLTPRKLPLRMFLHTIFRPDDDKDCHDHPWDFSSLILWNGYNEVQQNPTNWFLKTAKRFNSLSFRSMKAEFIHRLYGISDDRPVVTLVFAKKARRNWGFWVNDDNGKMKWVDWRTYLNLPNHPDHLEDVVD